MSSYREINYSIRPAKCIERKMLCEAIGRLSKFNKISRYRYIGFGSPYFTDFSLFHRRLGIKDLLSIEKDKHNKDRFLFNKPFSCIQMEFDESHNVLPRLDWDDKPSILWLDYDGKLDRNKLADVNTFFSKAQSGSMIIVSVNAQPDVDLNVQDIKAFRKDELVSRVGQARLPINIDEYTLALSDNYKALRDSINMEIQETLQERNGGLVVEDKMLYKQLFYFTYQDNAIMLTVGGIVYSAKDRDKTLEFDNLEFSSNGDEVFKIDVPNLTFKEIQALDALLPDKISSKGKLKLVGDEKIKPPKLVEKDIINYMKIYKYFPNFAEANF